MVGIQVDSGPCESELCCKVGKKQITFADKIKLTFGALIVRATQFV